MNLDDMFATNSSTDAIDNKLDAQRRIDKLGRTDRAILYLWCAGYSQKELAHIFSYSQSQISRILDKLHKNA